MKRIWINPRYLDKFNDCYRTDASIDNPTCTNAKPDYFREKHWAKMETHSRTDHYIMWFSKTFLEVMKHTQATGSYSAFPVVSWFMYEPIKSQCLYCSSEREASHYSMCKKCWWDRDPRNDQGYAAMSREDVVVDQSSQLLSEADDEAEFNRIIETARRIHKVSLDDILVIINRNEMAPVELRKYCSTLSAKKLT